MLHPLVRHGLLVSLCIPAIFAIPPETFTIQNTEVRNCTYAITAQVSANKSSIDILYDTSKSTGATPDMLAWTNTVDSLGSFCTVCTSLKWTNANTNASLYGLITSLDYDFWHRLDGGLLESVTSHIRRESDGSEEYFETSYIYGSDETNTTHRVQAHIPMASEPLVLDFAKESETICVETWFDVVNRVGFEWATGEISKKSVFVQSVNIEWQTEKPAHPNV